MAHHENTELNFTIGNIPVTLIKDFATVKVFFQLHGNSHDVPGDDPKRQEAETYIDAVKAVVPEDLLFDARIGMSQAGTRDPRTTVIAHQGIVELTFQVKGGKEQEVYEQAATALKQLAQDHPPTQEALNKNYSASGVATPETLKQPDAATFLTSLLQRAADEGQIIFAEGMDARKVAQDMADSSSSRLRASRMQAASGPAR